MLLVDPGSPSKCEMKSPGRKAQSRSESRNEQKKETRCVYSGSDTHANSARLSNVEAVRNGRFCNCLKFLKKPPRASTL